MTIVILEKALYKERTLKAHELNQKEKKERRKWFLSLSFLFPLILPTRNLWTKAMNLKLGEETCHLVNAVLANTHLPALFDICYPNVPICHLFFKRRNNNYINLQNEPYNKLILFLFY